jgi:hypothetical protein
MTTSMEAPYDKAWDAICADPKLERARSRLSIDEMRAIIEHVAAPFAAPVRESAPGGAMRLVPALIARLRAAERAREAEGWEDILLAPHDGTFVLVWCDHTPVVAFYAKAFGLDKEPAWRPVVEISRRLRPTHWRPLPAPPAAGGEDPMAWAGEQAKVCPECGCEEVDHRGLLTCRCPARLPAPPAPRAEVG